MAAPGTYIHAAARVSGFASEVIASSRMPRELLGVRCAIVSEMTRAGFSAEKIGQHMNRSANTIYWNRRIIREGWAPEEHKELALKIRAAAADHNSRRKSVTDACDAAVRKIRALEAELLRDLALKDWVER
jgi:transposase